MANCAVASGPNDESIDVSPCGQFTKYATRIGRGGFKTVFRGNDTRSGELVAWGELLSKKMDKKDRKAFRAEAELLRQLQHPNILEWRGYFEMKLEGVRKLVLITELMPAGTIRTYIDDFDGLQLSFIRSWCRQVLQGLSFLHSLPQPIIHRDLKCDNLFLKASNGPVKIGDFGLAIRKTDNYLDQVVGTAGYMAPEIYEEYYDEAVDVYAFGMSVLEMATCSYPYMECLSPSDLFFKVKTGLMPASFEAVENKEVREFIQMCTKFKKEHRPSCADLLKSEFLSRQENVVLEFPGIEQIFFLHEQQLQNKWISSSDSFILFETGEPKKNKPTTNIPIPKAGRFSEGRVVETQQPRFKFTGYPRQKPLSSSASVVSGEQPSVFVMTGFLHKLESIEDNASALKRYYTEKNLHKI